MQCSSPGEVPAFAAPMQGNHDPGTWRDVCRLRLLFSVSVLRELGAATWAKSRPLAGGCYRGHLKTGVSALPSAICAISTADKWNCANIGSFFILYSDMKLEQRVLWPGGDHATRGLRRCTEEREQALIRYDQKTTLNRRCLDVGCQSVAHALRCHRRLLRGRWNSVLNQLHLFNNLPH